MKIYLSPSRQQHNMYYGKYNNKSEKQVMELLAIDLGIKLLRYDVEVKIATTKLKVQDRVKEAKAWGADIYMALHSNASGTSPSTARGAVILTYKDKNHKLLSTIIDSLNTATPHGENRWDQLVNTTRTYEVIEPVKQGMLPIYLEVDFHDNPVTATYIVENTSSIALAIVDGLAGYYGMTKIPLPAETKPSSFYRVQVGAFNDKKNAEALQAELVKKGYLDTFVYEVIR